VTDYLTRVASASLGILPGLRPRPASMFEPVPAAALEEVWSERTVAPATATRPRDAVSRPASILPTLARVQSTSATAAPIGPRLPVAASMPTTSSSQSSPVGAEPSEHASPPSIAAKPGSVQLPQQPDRRVVDAQAVNLPAASLPAIDLRAANVPAVGPSADNPSTISQPADDPPAPGRPDVNPLAAIDILVQESTGQPTDGNSETQAWTHVSHSESSNAQAPDGLLVVPRPVLASLARRRTAPPPPQPPAPEPVTPQPPVRISIGRIDVRLVQPPGGERHPQMPAASPVQSLDDYLDRHTRGRA
jgi:hypothetical protein